VEYEDRLTISTPEGVDLDLPLAGLGSRFVAQLVDLILKTTIIVGLVLLLGLAAGDGGDTASQEDVSTGAAVAFAVLFIFALTFFYDVLFETLGTGRTPGKRLMGLRVLRAGGQPVGLRASVVRNLLRLVDGIPLSYIPGTVAILATKRNQRLGDLAAGTIVVRDPRSRGGAGRRLGHGRRRSTAPVAPAASAVAPGTEHWDVSAVTLDDLATVRRFLERRADLVPEARARLAADLASRLRPRVSGDEEAGDEPFLEGLAAAKANRA
jgi:uncharacterized RDD family membrane protein YckC